MHQVQFRRDELLGEQTLRNEIPRLTTTVRTGRDKDGQVLNLSGQLHGKFHQRLNARYVVPSPGVHFVPKPASRQLTRY